MAKARAFRIATLQKNIGSLDLLPAEQLRVIPAVRRAVNNIWKQNHEKGTIPDGEYLEPVDELGQFQLQVTIALEVVTAIITQLFVPDPGNGNGDNGTGDLPIIDN